MSVGRYSTQVYIIPGIELRLNIFTGSNQSINYHILFDPEHCTPDFIQENFLEQLSVLARGATYKLKVRNMLAIGHAIVNDGPINVTADYSHLPQAEKDKCYQAAYSTVTLEQRDIKSAHDAILGIFESQQIGKKPYVKIIAGKGHGSLKSLKWFDEEGQFSRVGLTREDLTNFTDMVFSNDPDDIDFYVGKRAKTPEKEVKIRFGSLKACVWGSDCHEIKTLLHPSNGNTQLYTWVKADPSFEGLKQLIFEPIDRVRIQEDKPQERTDYLVIDKVRFIMDPAAKDFGQDYIEMNTNMNAIIGGKSSGKSILLHHIAKAIDPGQVAEKGGVVKEKPYDFHKKIKAFDFEVVWRDGHVDRLSDGPDQKTRQITYIPQLFINHLAEEKGEEKLKQLIESILLQNKGFKTLWDKYKADIQIINTGITGNIAGLYALRETLKTATGELKALGDKVAISANIAKIKRDIEELRKTAGFTEEQNKRYEALIAKRDLINGKVSRGNDYIEKLINYLGSLETLKRSAIMGIESGIEDLRALYQNDYFAHAYIDFAAGDKQLTEKFFDGLMTHHQAMITALEGQIATSKVKLEAIQTTLQPFLTLITNQTLLKTLTDTLAADEAKLKSIADKEKTNQELITSGKKKKEELVENYKLLYNSYHVIETELQRPELSQISDLQLDSALVFNVTDFTNGFGNMLDNRANFRTLFGEYFSDKNEYVYDAANHIDHLIDIFDKISSPEKNGIKFKSGIVSQDAAFKLFADYFTFKYNIKQNGDDIIDMSPGKRGLVLMQLILHLSNAEHPILIDQPEDNLDNRTIFNELNQFMKDKKIQRQILIVTHNANLVVSTDAEQVIVANQLGQEKGKGNRFYQFEYVSGALENSFKKDKETGVLYQMGIREHVCDILEGGEDAFRKREEKYNF